MKIIFEIPDLSTIAAWVGALTGIAALLREAFVWRRSAHRVKVQCARAWVGYAQGGTSGELLSVEARNVGAAAVTVTGWGVSLGRGLGQLVVFTPLSFSTQLPHRLEAGAMGTFYAESEGIRDSAARHGKPGRELRAFVTLATGKKVYAKRGVPLSQT
ncbi:hypothetical protein [Curtobacterium sp. MCBD17_019]|uniref:hypothetical protein n=1 Tax=Curtobacterium sp. MCBD17_019 TaxID=2175669 RepID=UPI0011B6814B|nr:hypothetical protein [Curtobacterium sp. MCBD17_019]